MALTLTGLRDYLKFHHNASLSDMALHFDAAEDVVRSALDQWIAKGRVEKLAAGSVCSNAGSGCGCGCKMQELYAWVEPVRSVA